MRTRLTTYPRRIRATLTRWAARARRPLLTLAGFGALTASAWTWLGLSAGLAAAGLSCLLIELLSGGERQ
jgi:hypothetical protein